jgi:hypothetical protein
MAAPIGVSHGSCISRAGLTNISRGAEEAFVSLRTTDGLVWRQASLFGRAIEVTARDALAAILRLKGWISHCDAASAEGMWHFHREGFFWRRIVISESVGGGAVGVFHASVTGGRLVLSDGKEFIWKRISFWRQEMAFLTTSEFPIVKFAPKRFAVKYAGTISVSREYNDLGELPLLILLGTYLIVLAIRRARSS